MNNLCKTQLFHLLEKSSSIKTNEEIQNAYGIFLREIHTLNQPEVDYSIIFRTLSLTRIEFQSLQIQILYEQEEKCPKISLLAEGYFGY